MGLNQSEPKVQTVLHFFHQICLLGLLTPYFFYHLETWWGTCNWGDHYIAILDMHYLQCASEEWCQVVYCFLKQPPPEMNEQTCSLQLSDSVFLLMYWSERLFTVPLPEKSLYNLKMRCLTRQKQTDNYQMSVWSVHRTYTRQLYHLHVKAEDKSRSRDNAN